MYERRLKIFFAILVAMTGILLLRAAQLQLVDAEEYQKKATKSLLRSELLNARRGSILDFQGRELAIDEPCLVASVDYRAIERNPKWMDEQAVRRLGSEYRRSNSQQKKQLLEEERSRLNADLDLMWRTLAEVSGRTLEDIEHIRSSIRQRVDMRRRVVWYNRYKKATTRPTTDPADESEGRESESWFKEWLFSGRGAPEVDSFSIDVAEQLQAHVILENISTEVYNRLNKQAERFPGLVLERSKHRAYPFAATACCHLLGNLAPVSKDDLERDPDPKNELRHYLPHDLIGRTGIESLCERTLRGTRGQREWSAAERQVVSTTDPIPGKDVRLTIDAELQMEIEDAFRHVQWIGKDGNVEEEHEMHGAAVVLDVPTGQVRAMVSYPTYDPNKFEELYPALQADLLNLPLMNRATQMALEPGSTVKPIVGIGAITQGLRGVNEGHECTGYLIIDGRRYSTVGRCWTAKRFATLYGEKGQAHHAFGADPHPTGFLTFSDALQRSCNVYFESLGDRLKLQGLSYWYSQFGLGRRTGIGIAETTGRLPNQFDGPPDSVRPVQWFSAIGQSQVAATPLQMANVAATIARNGVWVRPTLLMDDHQRTPLPAKQPVEIPPQRVDLKISHEAVAAAKDGMIRVVNTAAGTGKILRNDRVLIAGKTGTAQVQPLRIPRRDSSGERLRDEKGRVIYDEPPVGTKQHPNPDLPWYRSTSENGKELSHAWLIGFAPAHNPKIAFAVMLEYGGGGGSDAGIVAKAVLDACMEHEYLPPEK